MEICNINGELTARGSRVAVVLGRFNSFIGESLLKGCLDCMERHEAESVDVYRVPGCYEIPHIAKKIAEGEKKYDAIICLGVIIRGDTPHFEFVANECAKGIAHVSLETGVYCSFGIVTTENIEQAIERAGTKAGNKGFDAAMSAIEMINLQKKM